MLFHYFAKYFTKGTFHKQILFKCNNVPPVGQSYKLAFSCSHVILYLIVDFESKFILVKGILMRFFVANSESDA